MTTSDSEDIGMCLPSDPRLLDKMTLFDKMMFLLVPAADMQAMRFFCSCGHMGASHNTQSRFCYSCRAKDCWTPVLNPYG